MACQGEGSNVAEPTAILRKVEVGEDGRDRARRILGDLKDAGILKEGAGLWQAVI